MSSYPKLLSEGRIGRLRLKNRILHAPMARGMSNRDGTITQTHLDYLAARAKGGAALVTTEGVYVDPIGNSHAPALGIHSDAMIPGLRRAGELIHSFGASYGIELFYAGRVGRQWVPFRQPLGPSAVPCHANTPPSQPREMTIADIKRLVQSYVRAAERAVEAGVDLLWLHGGHGYLISAFVSPFSNRRTDEYGGSLAGRARLPLEIIAAVRAAIGPDVPIAYRLNAQEYLEGALTIDEAIPVAAMLADAGIDLIDVTGGLYETKEFSIQGSAAPQGGFVDNAVKIKESLGDRVPVSVVQKMNNPAFADEVLREHNLDFVSMARAFHADPEFVSKLEQGRAQDIIPCIACLRCLDLHGVPGSTVQCATNSATGFERRRHGQVAALSRRVTVVGGGVAGMESAVQLARQGHAVTLLEGSGQLGGQVLLSARTAPDHQKLVDYLSIQLRKHKVVVKLNVVADVAMVDDTMPDVVVIATGVKRAPWFWEVEGSPKTFHLLDAYSRPADDWEPAVVLIGGDAWSCSLAQYLATLGVDVHVVEPRPLFAHDTYAASRSRIIDQLERDERIHLYPETTVELIGEGFVTLQSRNEYSRCDGVGSVVIGERVSNNDLYEQIIATSPERELYAVGDCTYPRDIYAATQAAAEIAELIRLKSNAHIDSVMANTAGERH